MQNRGVGYVKARYLPELQARKVSPQWGRGTVAGRVYRRPAGLW